MNTPRLTRQLLLDTFAGYGCAREDFRVGGEFERAVVRPDGSPVGYFDEDGIGWILEQLAAREGWTRYREGDNVIALLKDGASITLEPGGQVELSGRPHDTLSELAAEMRGNREALLAIAEGRDLRWIAAGLTPVAAIEDINFVPKGRYAIMRDYLPGKGDLAHFMMKGTCSVQANFDYIDEADCAEKVRLCAGLAPLTTALFSNSPLYRNKPTGFMSYRGHIWTRTDPDRTGFPPGLRNDYSHERWVDYLLDVPMMFYKAGDTWVPAHGRSFRTYMTQGFDGYFPDAEAWSLHQTSVFPEVRVKHTIEVRGADCVDHELALSFCALFTGLLYCSAAQAEALAMVAELEQRGTRDERLAAACRTGLEGELAGRPTIDWARDLGAIADRGLRNCLPDDHWMLDPLLARISSGRSPARDVLDAWERDPDPHSVVQSLAY